MTTRCTRCGKAYMQVDIDHEWPSCNCHVDPTCRHCEGTGEEWRIEEDEETGEWFRVLRPCRCKTHDVHWGVVAAIAILFGVLPALYWGLK